MVYKWVEYEAFGGVGRSTVEGHGMVVRTVFESCHWIITGWALGRVETCEDSKPQPARKGLPETSAITLAANREFWNGDTAASSLPNCAKDITYSLVLRRDRSG